MEIVKDETKMLTQEELTKIQEMNSDFTKAKIALGDAEIHKHKVLKEIDRLVEEFAANEKYLIDKYGANAVINIKTGEVTEKTEE
jgi:hypothetical protein